MGNKEQDLESAVREIRKRSAVDPVFRQLAVKDSAAALEKMGKKDVARNTPVTFLDNYGKSHKTIVLPDPVSGSESLTEEELERVAGGLAPSCEATSCGTSK